MSTEFMSVCVLYGLLHSMVHIPVNKTKPKNN